MSPAAGGIDGIAAGANGSRSAGRGERREAE